MALRLFGNDISINEARQTYNELRLMFKRMATDASARFTKRYAGLGSCGEFAEQGFEIGAALIGEAIDQGADYLIERGCYDMTRELLLERCAGKLTWPHAMSHWEELYDGIYAEEANENAQRRQRRDQRSRFVGGGFGVAGAAKGIAAAGVANLGWGLAHKLANGVGAASSRKQRERALAQLLADREVARSLTGYVEQDCFFIHFVVYDQLLRSGLEDAPSFVTDENMVAMSKRLKTNVSEGKVPDEKLPGILFQILEGDPYDEGSYRLALRLTGDPHQDLEAYARFHGVDIGAMKMDLISKETTALLGRSNPDYTAVIAHARDRSVALGNAQSEALQQLLASIDLTSRTFDGHAYGSIAQADQARAELAHLKALTDKVGKSVEKARERLAELKETTFIYPKAAAMIGDFTRRIDALDVQQRTFEEHLYATLPEAEQARREHAQICEALGRAASSDPNALRDARNWISANTTTYVERHSFVAHVDAHVRNLEFLAAKLPGHTSIADQSLHVFPHIPESKLESFIASAQKLVPGLAPIDIVVYFDDTLFGGGDDGAALTANELIVTLDEIGAIPYTDIVSIHAASSLGIKITIARRNGAEVSFKLTQGDKGPRSFVTMLQKLAGLGESAAGPLQRDAGAGAPLSPPRARKFGVVHLLGGGVIAAAMLYPQLEKQSVPTIGSAPVAVSTVAAAETSSAPPAAPSAGPDQLIDQLKLVMAEDEERGQALGARFQATDVNLDTLVNPSTFTDASRLAQARNSIDQYRQLVAQRQQQIAELTARIGRIVEGATGQFASSDELTSFKRAAATLESTYAKVDANQLAYLDGAGALLDIAERCIGSTTRTETGVMFAQQADQDAYTAAQARVQRIMGESQALSAAATSAYSFAHERLAALSPVVRQ